MKEKGDEKQVKPKKKVQTAEGWKRQQAKKKEVKPNTNSQK